MASKLISATKAFASDGGYKVSELVDMYASCIRSYARELGKIKTEDLDDLTLNQMGEHIYHTTGSHTLKNFYINMTDAQWKRVCKKVRIILASNEAALK